MLLLITLLAHSFLSYLNRKLHIQAVATVAVHKTSSKKQHKCSQVCEEPSVLENTLLGESIEPKRDHIEASYEFSIESVSSSSPAVGDIEPELFPFNESFDANLLDLNIRRRRRDLLSSSASHSSSSTAVNHSDATSVELLNNLNKLYANNLDSSTSSTSLCPIIATTAESVITTTTISMMSFDTAEVTFTCTPRQDEDEDDSIATFSPDDFIDFDEEEPQSNLDELCSLNLIISSPICPTSQDETISRQHRRLSSRSLFLNSTRQHHQKCVSRQKKVRLSRTITTSTSSTNTSQTNSPSQSSKQRRLRTKLERLNHTKNFYSRLNQQSTMSPNMRRSRTSTSSTYRPSFKVEKLLNDSRGMKKYLIDYDCLFDGNVRQHDIASKSVSFSHADDFSVDLKSIHDDFIALPYSNRCSSGYLSDC